jgi:putative ABC transport system ATP-binding protein
VTTLASSPDSPQRQVPAEPDTRALCFDDVRFAYPGQPQATIRISQWALARGERVMLRGPSGCGKSTLLGLAAGVLLAQAGSVKLLGRDWASMSAAARDAQRVDHVGYIFQQFNLLPYLSVLDNVLLPCQFSSRRRNQARETHGQPRLAAMALLEELELPAALHHRSASELSVGQQQRVAAARALIGAPEVVIADEPTSALDEDRREGFMRLLLAQCQRAGSALLFVTHDARLSVHFERVVDLPALNETGH